ncbi:hypothetical protein BH24ACT1_BH24ACT1_03010 [soil metagenome]
MAVDPVRRQRVRVARLASAGKRLGFALFGLAMVVFVAGLLTTFSDSVANTVVACLLVGSLILAPAIILGYATKAAERQDRERGL